jgi:predicted Zn finger-like uncharacterized protein
MMMHLFQCPSCGQRIRWPDDQLHRTVRCPACNYTFTASPSEAIARMSPRERETERRDIVFKLGRKVGVEAGILLDGAIGAALGGMFTGILIGGITGAFADVSNDGMRIGGVIAGIFNGLIAGILVGIVVGLLVGCSANIITHDFALPLRRVPLLAGLITGAAVAVLLGSIWWTLVGAGLGACGTMLWGALITWAEATMNSSAYRRHAAAPHSTELPPWEITEPMLHDLDALRGRHAPAGHRP